MRLLLLAVVVVCSCGQPNGESQAIVDRFSEQPQLIFADQLADGQYCFYRATIAKQDLPPPCDQQELRRLTKALAKAKRSRSPGHDRQQKRTC